MTLTGTSTFFALPLASPGVLSYLNFGGLLLLLAFIGFNYASNRRINVLKQFINFPDSMAALEPTFDGVHIPPQYFRHFSRRQISTLLHAAAPVPSLPMGRYTSPFLVSRASLKASNKQGLLTCSMEIDALAPCRIELFAGVRQGAIEKRLGIDNTRTIQKTASAMEVLTSMEGQNTGNETAIPMQCFRDPSRSTQSAPSNDLAFQSSEVEFSAEAVTLAVGRRQIVTLKDIPVHKALLHRSQQPRNNIRSGASLVTAERDVTDADSLPNTTMNEAYANQKPTPTHRSRPPPYMPLVICVYTVGGTEVASTCLWLLVSLRDAEEDGVQLVESVDVLLRTNQQDKITWWEVGEIYGGSNSQQNLSSTALEPLASPISSPPLCVVCLTDPANVIVLPCRHYCMCFDCWNGNESIQEHHNDRPHNTLTPDPTENGDQGNSNTDSEPAARATRTRWDTCPVCRGQVGAWIESK